MPSSWERMKIITRRSRFTRSGPGQQPEVTDAELVCIAAAQVLLRLIDATPRPVRALGHHRQANRPAPGTAVVTDKGLSGEDFEEFLAGPGLGGVGSARAVSSTCPGIRVTCARH